MSVYLDASVVVPLFVKEATSERLYRWLEGGVDVRLSGWTVAEVSSALSHHERRGVMAPEERARVEIVFDRWLDQKGSLVEIEAADFLAARVILRRRRALRTPDALHLAIVARLGAVLATHDDRLAEAAVLEGVEVVTP